MYLPCRHYTLSFSWTKTIIQYGRLWNTLQLAWCLWYIVSLLSGLLVDSLDFIHISLALIRLVYWHGTNFWSNLFSAMNARLCCSMLISNITDKLNFLCLVCSRATVLPIASKKNAKFISLMSLSNKSYIVFGLTVLWVSHLSAYLFISSCYEIGSYARTV
jgi:hypothetical protein